MGRDYPELAQQKLWEEIIFLRERPEFNGRQLASFTVRPKNSFGDRKNVELIPLAAIEEKELNQQRILAEHSATIDQVNQFIVDRGLEPRKSSTINSERQLAAYIEDHFGNFPNYISNFARPEIRLQLVEAEKERVYRAIARQSTSSENLLLQEEKAFIAVHPEIERRSGPYYQVRLQKKYRIHDPLGVLHKQEEKIRFRNSFREEHARSISQLTAFISKHGRFPLASDTKYRHLYDWLQSFSGGTDTYFLHFSSPEERLQLNYEVRAEHYRQVEIEHGNSTITELLKEERDWIALNSKKTRSRALTFLSSKVENEGHEKTRLFDPFNLSRSPTVRAELTQHNRAYFADRIARIEAHIRMTGRFPHVGNRGTIGLDAKWIDHRLGTQAEYFLRYSTPELRLQLQQRVKDHFYGELLSQGREETVQAMLEEEADFLIKNSPVERQKSNPFVFFEQSKTFPHVFDPLNIFSPPNGYATYRREIEKRHPDRYRKFTAYISRAGSLYQSTKEALYVIKHYFESPVRFFAYYATPQERLSLHPYERELLYLAVERKFGTTHVDMLLSEERSYFAKNPRFYGRKALPIVRRKAGNKWSIDDPHGYLKHPHYREEFNRAFFHQHEEKVRQALSVKSSLGEIPRTKHGDDARKARTWIMNHYSDSLEDFYLAFEGATFCQRSRSTTN